MIDSSIYRPAPPLRVQPARLDVAVERRDLAAARLVFARRAAHVTLSACELEDQLLVGTFFKRLPEVASERSGTVVIRHPRTSVLDYRAFSGEVALAAGVTWTVEGEGGQADMVLDVSAAALDGLQLSGGQIDLIVKLPRPAGVVPIVLDGGAFHVEIVHPPGVPVDVRIAGGADECALYGRELAATDADVRAGDRDLRGGGYAISVTGGATRLFVGLARS